MDDRKDSGTVLIVDDDLDVLASNARFLRVSNYSVIVSNHPYAALEQIENEAIDAVVTDLRMPDMDGVKLARKARALKPLLPILFFSAFGSVPDVVSAMQLGAVDFLEKPVDPELLLERLDDMLGKHSDAHVHTRMAFEDGSVPFRLRVLAYEKYLIETCLAEHDGKISTVLEELNINRRTLNEKMTRLGIQREPR